MYKNILVAIDDSSTSILALNEALKFAQDGVHIRIITVIENPLAGYGMEPQTYNYEVMHDVFIQHGKNILNKAATEAKKLKNIEIELHLIDMGPQAEQHIASAIMKDAEDSHAELIIMGTHARSRMNRFFLGSIAEQVIRHSRTPVLTVRGKQDNTIL